MIILDAHCDTLLKISYDKKDLYRNSCHLDVKRMVENGKSVQFFAAFIRPELSTHALLNAIQMIDNLFINVKLYNEYIDIAYSVSDIQKITDSGKVAAIISIEGGDALSKDLSVLRTFYRLGVRSLGLTWNFRNQIAEGVSDDSGTGLTSFGRSVIEEMNRIGMVIDLSHINKKGFWDVLELTKQPVIASHSNAQTLCVHKRNLDDWQLAALKDNGGVVGINFYPSFLREDSKATVNDVLLHIEYIAGLIGYEHVGFGSDFDGIEQTPKGLEGVECFPDLINRLYRLNYSEEQVKAITSGNFLRVLSKVIGQ